ncbi:calcium release-activated calcium channel protein 1-like [Onthophagus taurus]|uniref:calcium release-activated calcium channel protein 1-like n=1 Tax=Onthophagus taurus TaxID=166361 RepID=UPI000C20D577|nr:calcium release-activated calcium channel protein 1-like [Onthophagus taurus]
MDQSTQVNFPTQPKRANITRYNTSADLNVGTRQYNNGNNNNNWLQMRPISSKDRQNFVSTETFHQRSRLFYQSELSKNSPTTSEVSLTQHWRERGTPPVSNATFNYNVPLKQKNVYIGGSDTSCKCSCEEDNFKNKGYATNSPEGLSWRRLHMSRAKLKATATTSELLSGFAMVAMVELQINDPTSVPQWLFVLFAVCTTVLVAVHIFALMISTYILPNIDAISKLDVCELVSESPHERMRGFIELAWAFSTILGLFLFLVEVAILCWVKFWDYSFEAAIASTVIVIPVLVIFVLFAVHFYHSLVVYRCDTSMSDMQKLEDMKKQLDEISTSQV